MEVGGVGEFSDERDCHHGDREPLDPDGEAFDDNADASAYGAETGDGVEGCVDAGETAGVLGEDLGDRVRVLIIEHWETGL